MRDYGPAKADYGPAKADYRPAKAGHYVLRAFIFAFTVVGAAQSTDSPTTVWQGVYTQAQAARGQSEYATHCANCHRDDLSGYNDILKGRRFMEKYRESTLHLLFDKTKTTMPRGAPATLSDKAYVDIVSYVLKVNEFPAGDRELRVEDLTRIQVVGKDGPEPVPDFSLVRVVGCLTANPSDGAWILTHSTDPVRTGNPQPATGSARRRKHGRLFPERTAFSFPPRTVLNPQRHKVYVRGFHPPPDRKPSLSLARSPPFLRE